MAGKRSRIKTKSAKNQKNLRAGMTFIFNHPLLNGLDGIYFIKDTEYMGKGSIAKVEADGHIYLNGDMLLEPLQWLYVAAHCQMHLALGHFDEEYMPETKIKGSDGKITHKAHINRRVWNLACDIYITKLLKDMNIGHSIVNAALSDIDCSLKDEITIYEHLMATGETGEIQSFGTAAINSMDMIGLDKPVKKSDRPYEENPFMAAFAEQLAYCAAQAVCISGGNGSLYGRFETDAQRAKQWFISAYPLLGSIASAFELIEDQNYCIREEISIAAINMDLGEIYINPAAGLNFEEMKFVMAHEFLHAGLSHNERCQGRNPYLWNVSCDYVINGWLNEMGIGKMPSQGLLYDEKYKGWSAESIYDELVLNIRKNSRLNTLRGYGKGDVIGSGISMNSDGISLDEFCKNALTQGLEYHSSKRGTVPAGLVEEIRALAMPPVKWDIKLAKWFEGMFAPVEKRHTYARPSRRQGTTPDIPRPRYVESEIREDSRTFGVVIDTSGSMSAKLIGMALGSIASYAAAKEVPFARVVFCDARAYDAGYLSPEDIAGRVEVKGRGGTRLQPAIDLLENAKDFPKDGPLLIITDGEIESSLYVRRKHAFLLPKGSGLPFRAKGEIFHFE